jgi:hypothetical protein
MYMYTHTQAIYKHIDRQIDRLIDRSVHTLADEEAEAFESLRFGVLTAVVFNEDKGMSSSLSDKSFKFTSGFDAYCSNQYIAA